MYYSPYPYYFYPPVYYPHPHSMEREQQIYPKYQEVYEEKHEEGKRFHPLPNEQENMDRQDRGGSPYVVNIERATERNQAFRRAIWTGRHLQVTLMSIQPGEDIGLEIHRNTDQFLRVEEGQGIVQMGDRRDNLNFQQRISDDDAIMIPAGKWHNIRNNGRRPLKLYSIYAPPEHPKGTVHQTRADAMAAESHNREGAAEFNNEASASL